MTTVEWIVIGSALFAVYLFVELRSRRKRKAKRPTEKTPRKASVTPRPKAAYAAPLSRKAVETSSQRGNPPALLCRPCDPKIFKNLPVAQQAEIVGDVCSVLAAIYSSHRVLIDGVAQHHPEGRDGETAPELPISKRKDQKALL